MCKCIDSRSCLVSSADFTRSDRSSSLLRRVCGFVCLWMFPQNSALGKLGVLLVERCRPFVFSCLCVDLAGSTLTGFSFQTGNLLNQEPNGTPLQEPGSTSRRPVCCSLEIPPSPKEELILNGGCLCQGTATCHGGLCLPTRSVPPRC